MITINVGKIAKTSLISLHKKQFTLLPIVINTTLFLDYISNKKLETLYEDLGFLELSSMIISEFLKNLSQNIHILY